MQDDIEARLREKVRVLPARGSGSISANGDVVTQIWDDGMRPANRDGAEAAATIASLRAEVERLRVIISEDASREFRRAALRDSHG